MSERVPEVVIREELQPIIGPNAVVPGSNKILVAIMAASAALAATATNPPEAYAGEPTAVAADAPENCECTSELTQLLKEHFKPKPRGKGPSLYTKITKFLAENLLTQAQVEQAIKDALEAYHHAYPTTELDPVQFEELRSALIENNFSLGRIEVLLSQLSQQVDGISRSLKRPELDVSAIFVGGYNLQTLDAYGEPSEHLLRLAAGFRSNYGKFVAGATVGMGMGMQKGFGKYPVVLAEGSLGVRPGGPDGAFDISLFGRAEGNLAGGGESGNVGTIGLSFDLRQKIGDRAMLTIGPEVGLRAFGAEDLPTRLANRFTAGINLRLELGRSRASGMTARKGKR